ncbi:MAG: hypothetical protein R3E89_12820 [Thiolinea sp.]
MQDMAGMTFPRLQAGAVRQRKQPSLLWTPETLTAEDIEDEVHARWLDEIENRERPESGSRFVRSTRQALLWIRCSSCWPTSPPNARAPAARPFDRYPQQGSAAR